MGLVLGDSLLRNDKQLELILDNKVDKDTEQVITGKKILRSNETVLDGISLHGNNITPINTTADTKIGSETNPFNKGFFNQLTINGKQIDEQNIAYLNTVNKFTKQNTFTTELIKEQANGYAGYNVKNTSYTLGSTIEANTGLGRFMTSDSAGNYIAYLQTSANSTWTSNALAVRQSNGSGGYNQNSFTIFSNATERWAVLSSQFRPATTSAYSLGNPDYRWKNLYLSNDLDYGNNNKLSLVNNGLILSGNASLTLRGNGTNTNGLKLTGTAITPEINANTDIGSSSYKFKNLYLSGNLSDGTNNTNIASIVTLNGSQTLSKKTLNQLNRYIGVCNTDASTADKVVTINNFILTEGTEILVKFTNAGISMNNTLNVSGTGAKQLRAQMKLFDGNWYQDRTASDICLAGETLLLRYVNGYWFIIENISANRIYKMSPFAVDKATPQTITGLKTFQNSIKVGQCTINYNTTNKALEFNF